MHPGPGTFAQEHPSHVAPKFADGSKGDAGAGADGGTSDAEQQGNDSEIMV